MNILRHDQRLGNSDGSGLVTTVRFLIFIAWFSAWNCSSIQMD